jgi:hypothetical protein
MNESNRLIHPNPCVAGFAAARQPGEEAPSSIERTYPDGKIDVQSELILTGLSTQEIDLLQKNSKGFIAIEEFINLVENESFVYFGLWDETFDALRKVISPRMPPTELKDGDRKYSLTYGVDEYLSYFLAHENLPIAFLVPRDVLDPSKSRFTLREMRWFLNHPESLKNVQFVIGANNVLTESSWRNLKRGGRSTLINSLISIFRSMCHRCFTDEN